jgi:hypothetical protein
MSHMSIEQHLVKLGVELGLSVSDYNSGITENLDDVVKLTLAYLAVLREGVQVGRLEKEEIQTYFALIGQSWGSVRGRFDNEYLVTAEGGDKTKPTENSKN